MLAKADLQEQLLATVLRTDRDGDLQIDDREANILILRMKNRGGLEFNEERVRSALLQTNGSVRALLNILRQIGDDVDDDVGDDEEEDVLVRVNDRMFMESLRESYTRSSMAEVLGEDANKSCGATGSLFDHDRLCK